MAKETDLTFEQYETDDSRLFTQLINSMELSIEDMVQNTDSENELWEVLVTAFDCKRDLSRIYDSAVGV